MLLSRITKIFSHFSAGENRGKGYLESHRELKEVPGQGQHQGNRYNQRRSRLVRFRQVLSANKRTGHTGYNSPTSQKKKLFKLVGLSTVAASILIFVTVGGGQIILNTLESLPFFQISELVIFGTETVSQDELREASGLVLHQTSLIGLDCTEVEASLLSVPWVARVDVKRNWPSTIEVYIAESVPVALLYSNDAKGEMLQYIDKKGVPFLRVRPGDDIDYPVITGLTEIDTPQVRQQSLSEVLVFLKKLQSNNPYLPAQSVSEIHLDQDGEMVLYLVETPFPIFFGSSNIKNKYSRLVQVLKALYKNRRGKGSIAEIDYIQMDYLDDKVLVAQNE